MGHWFPFKPRSRPRGEWVYACYVENREERSDGNWIVVMTFVVMIVIVLFGLGFGGGLALGLVGAAAGDAGLTGSIGGGVAPTGGGVGSAATLEVLGRQAAHDDGDVRRALADASGTA